MPNADPSPPTSRLLALSTVLLVAACSHTDERPICRITPIHTGVCQIGADHVLGGDHTSEERLPFVIYAFLIEGPNGERALVDLGPKSLEYTNRMFRTHGFFRDRGPAVPAEERYPDDRYPDDIVQPEGNVFAQLERLGVARDEIDHVVFTHLHADHHGMHDAKDGGAAEDLPEALLWVSKRGWDDNLAKRQGDRWASYVDFAFADFLLEREKAGKARFSDDAEVFPGLRTMYLGGHSVCSQAVIVDTASGPVVIASDDIYLYALLEENILPEIRTSEAKYREAIERIVDFTRRERAIIVPLHDPVVWSTWQETAGESAEARSRAWLAALRQRSDQALRGYAGRRGE